MMNTLPLNATFREVAKRVIWFESPEEALRDTVRFVAYAMSHATFDDMQIIREHLNDDDLRDVLAKAPPGIIDPRSWAYWHVVLGQYPAPSMPKRTFGE
jgi:hypothetical protein